MSNQQKILSNFKDHKMNNGIGVEKDIHSKQEQSEIKNHPYLKVLMYHRVVDDIRLSEKSELCVHVDDFRMQMQIITHLGFTPVTFNDIKLFSDGEIELPKKPLIITFDDGFLDIYNHAYPILKEYGMRAVVFVLGDRGIRSNIWDRNNSEIPSADLMENHHIKELHEKDFEIGAHSLIHSDLSRVPEGHAFREIKSSKMILDSLLGTSIQSFAYPFGSVNAKIKELTIKSGYEYGCGVYSGPAKFGEDLFDIRRIVIHNNTTIPGFIMRLITPYQFMEWFWWKAKNFRHNYLKKS